VRGVTPPPRRRDATVAESSKWKSGESQRVACDYDMWGGEERGYQREGHNKTSVKWNCLKATMVISYIQKKTGDTVAFVGLNWDPPLITGGVNHY